DHVVAPNKAHAEAVTQRLRREIRGVVIDPTAANDFPHWSQDDYRALWARVIEEFAKEVVFVDDWQYSNGCCYEFLIAQQNLISTLDERLKPLTLSGGVSLIGSAIAETTDQPISFRERVLVELGQLVSNVRGKHADTRDTRT